MRSHTSPPSLSARPRGWVVVASLAAAAFGLASAADTEFWRVPDYPRRGNAPDGWCESVCAEASVPILACGDGRQHEKDALALRRCLSRGPALQPAAQGQPCAARST